MGLFATIKHIRRLSALEERVEQMERTVRGLETEWTETYDNNRRILGKIAKRAKFVEKHEAQEAENETTGPEPADGGLSPTQLAAQREIMARRRLSGVR